MKSLLRKGSGFPNNMQMLAVHLFFFIGKGCISQQFAVTLHRFICKAFV